MYTDVCTRIHYYESIFINLYCIQCYLSVARVVTNTHVCMHIYVYMYVYIHVYVYMCMYTHVCVKVYVYKCMNTHVCMYTCATSLAKLS